MDISRRDFIVNIIFSLFASVLIVFATPVNYQLTLPRKVSLEINAIAQKNPLSAGTEVGILTASVDGTVIPWSEFTWEGNWDKIDDRPYFHVDQPAQLVWQGYAKEGLLSLSLVSSSSTGILVVKWNGGTHTIDTYENSTGSIKQMDFPVPQRNWRFILLALIFIIAIGILIFMGAIMPRPFFGTLLIIGAIIVNLTVFQKE